MQDLLNIAIKNIAYRKLEKKYNLTPANLDYLILLDQLSKDGMVRIKLVRMRNLGVYSDITMVRANDILEHYKYVERRKRIKTEPYYLYVTEAGKAVIKDVERTIKREAKKLLNIV
jgi:DNA-binding MarR family transcriptional regulator